MCPGLGPSELHLLGIEKEFIGTREDPVILDYPSPILEGTSSFEVLFTPGELEKARAKCLQNITTQEQRNTSEQKKERIFNRYRSKQP